MRKGITYAQLVEKHAAIGVDEKEVNVRNKRSRANPRRLTQTMFKSDWKLYAGIGIAIGIVVGCYLIHQWDSRHYYESPEDNQQIEGSGIAVVNALPAPDQEQYGYNRGEQKPDYDTRSVWAAEDAAYWAMVAALVGGAGSFFVATSLFYSAKAANAALDAAKSARDMFDNDRAWITQGTIDFAVLQNSFVDNLLINFGFKFDPKWENTGRRPAVDVRIKNDSKMVIANGPIPIFPSEKIIEEGKSAIAIGQSVGGNSIFLNDIEAGQFMNRTHNLWIHSHVEYMDVFNRSKELKSEVCICIKYMGPRNESGGYNISSTLVGPQNNLT